MVGGTDGPVAVRRPVGHAERGPTDRLVALGRQRADLRTVFGGLSRHAQDRADEVGVGRTRARAHRDRGNTEAEEKLPAHRSLLVAGRDQPARRSFRVPYKVVKPRLNSATVTSGQADEPIVYADEAVAG